MKPKNSPEFKSVRVSLSYRLSNGLQRRAAYKNDKKKTPKEALLEGFDDLARTCAFYNLDKEAFEILHQAIDRIAAYRKVWETEEQNP
jgi:hypothetical protein